MDRGELLRSGSGRHARPHEKIDGKVHSVKAKKPCLISYLSGVKFSWTSCSKPG